MTSAPTSDDVELLFQWESSFDLTGQVFHRGPARQIVAGDVLMKLSSPQQLIGEADTGDHTWTDLEGGVTYTLAASHAGDLGAFVGSSELSVVLQRDTLLQIEFAYWGCLAPEVSGVPEDSPVEIRVTNGVDTFVSDSNNPFFRLLPGEYSITVDGIGRGQWTVVSGQCLQSTMTPPESVMFTFLLELVDPTLDLQLDRVVVQTGDTIQIDEGASAVLVFLELKEGASLTLEKGSSVTVLGLSVANSSIVVQEDSALSVSQGVALTDSTTFDISESSAVSFAGSLSSDSDLAITGGGQLTLQGNLTTSGSLLVSEGTELSVRDDFVVADGSVVSVANATVGVLGSFDFQGANSILVIGQGSSLQISGDLVAEQGGQLFLDFQSRLNVTGRFDAESVNFTLTGLDRLPPCETGIFELGSLGESGLLPAAFISNNPGISVTPSYEQRTLSIAVTPIIDDPENNPCQDSGALNRTPWWVWGAPLISLVLMVVFAVVFYRLVLRSYLKEKARRTAKLRSKLAQKREADIYRLRQQVEEEVDSVNAHLEELETVIADAGDADIVEDETMSSSIEVVPDTDVSAATVALESTVDQEQ